ncbi:MAG: ATP synthase F1 subunit delta [Gemmatimonadales bacterium]|nr:ATP synthase F1 subunit delta [Gemmatimonadales bacterium]
MREITIARNYAETLLALAQAAGAPEAWGTLMDEAAAALGSPSIEAVMMSPRVTKERKVEIIRHALAGAPAPFILFLAAVVKRGRQMLLPRIADEYRVLVDVQLNRVRASVTLARDTDALTRQVLVERLTAAIGKEVIAAFTTDPSLLGGVVVKIGDRVYDGSVKKRLGRLRNQLIAKV